MRKIGTGEIIILGVLVSAAILAFPAVRDSYLFESVYVAVCAGLGIPVK